MTFFESLFLLLLAAIALNFLDRVRPGMSDFKAPEGNFLAALILGPGVREAFACSSMVKFSNFISNRSRLRTHI